MEQYASLIHKGGVIDIGVFTDGLTSGIEIRGRAINGGTYIPVRFIPQSINPNYTESSWFIPAGRKNNWFEVTHKEVLAFASRTWKVTR